MNCDKALDMLNWKSTLQFNETIRFTIEWYKEFYEFKENISKKSSDQINEYIHMQKIFHWTGLDEKIGITKKN